MFAHKHAAGIFFHVQYSPSSLSPVSCAAQPLSGAFSMFERFAAVPAITALISVSLVLRHYTSPAPILRLCSAKFEKSKIVLAFCSVSGSSFVAGMELGELPQTSSLKLLKVAFSLRRAHNACTQA